MAALGKVVDEGGPVAILQGVKRRRKLKGLKGWDYDRKGRVDVRGCVEAFVAGRRCKAGSVESTGTVLYSYSTVIARWLDNGALEMNCAKYSVTTSKMQSFLRSAVEGWTTVRCINVPETKRARRLKYGQRFLE